MDIRQEFRDFLSESKINETKLDESVISAIADTVKLFGYKKDDISYTKNSQKNFEKISIFDNDIHKLEKLGNTIKKATDNKLVYIIIYTENNYGEETKALYISNIENTLIDKKRILKRL